MAQDSINRRNKAEHKPIVTLINSLPSRFHVDTSNLTVAL